MNIPVIMAFAATMATWFVTALGSATVVFFKSTNEKVLNLMLGFAAGVMIAASFWSLLQPAIEMCESFLNKPAWLVTGVSFILGAIFIWSSDKAVAFARRNLLTSSSAGLNRVILLVLSITLHNIPEGLAVGVAFGVLNGNFSVEALMGAVTIAIGIGLQNFPEGAAVSLPLRREGIGRGKSFLIGQASALVEPIFGVIGALCVISMQNILPYALSFAAGAMILVAVHELIPECQQNQKADPYFATMGIVAGFTIMMILDVALG